MISIGSPYGVSRMAHRSQPRSREDRTLMLADVAYKALVQAEYFTPHWM